MIYFQLFFEFFKAGVFAIGGGLATLPFLYQMGAKTGWFSATDVANMLAISESTPGPIGVNMATYVGYHTAHIPGAIIATLGLIAPSIIVILLVASFMKAFYHNRYLQGALYGLRPVSTALIAAAGVGVIWNTLFNIDLLKTTAALLDLLNRKALALAIVILVLTNIKPLKKLHPAVFLLFCAAVGVAFQFT